MNRTSAKILICLCLLLPGVSVAAPVGNIYDPARWDIRPFEHSSPLSLIVSLEVDRQDNSLPEQIRRFPWTNLNITPPEERHYSQTRSSRNILTTYGAKIGKPLNDIALVYALVGAFDTEIDFHYEDWTISRDFASDDTFTSGPSLYYGIGATFLMLKGQYENTVPYSLGMDINYRRFDFEDDRIASHGTSYSCVLDEIQLAFSLSARLPSFSPYAGVKVASITGKETYINRNHASPYFSKGYIDYDDDITWFKNIGYFFGMTVNIKELFSLGFEVRAGDEKGMGLTATTRF